jgi:hypothetical protein
MPEEQLNEALGSVRIPLLLKENVSRGAVLIHSAPQPVLLASDPHRQLIQVPHAPGSRLTRTQRVANCGPAW